MSQEATVSATLTVNKTDVSATIQLISYSSQPSSFTGNVNGTKGPSPGSITVPTAGLDVSFPQLTTPGYCRMMNQDPTNFVEYGIRDPASNHFYPLGEILPGESYVLRFSRNLGEEYVGTGTGTSGPINFLHIKADTAPCSVLVEAFET